MNNIVPSPISWTLSPRHSELASESHGMPKQVRHDSKTIGVLALQGDFLEHIQVLEHLGFVTQEVRLPKDLTAIDAIILPGGESTTQANLLDVFELREPLRKKIELGMPVWGTCAGMILLARELTQDRPIPLGVMDITVNRNAFGRQADSFETDLHIKKLGNKPLRATFIRAPRIERIGEGVSILAVLSDKTIVAARQNNMLVTSFHPEITGDSRLHKYFASFVSSPK